MSRAKDILMAAVTLCMLVSTYLLYDNDKPVLDYMEYLPVYRVEQLWERRESGGEVTLERDLNHIQTR